MSIGFLDRALTLFRHRRRNFFLRSLRILKMVPVLGLLHPTHIVHHMRFLSLRALSSGHQYAFGFNVLLGIHPASDAAFFKMLLIILSLSLMKGLHTGTRQFAVQKTSMQKESKKHNRKRCCYIRPVPLNYLSQSGTERYTNRFQCVKSVPPSRRFHS